MVSTPVDPPPSIRDLVNTLPAGTKEYVGASIGTIKRMIIYHRKQLDRGKTSNVYLHFSHLPASQIDRIVNRPEWEIFERHPVAYDMELGSLIVKARIFPYGIGRTHFGKMLYITAKSMNLDDNLMPDGSATVMGPTAGNSPDDSYQPYPLPPGLSDEWPTLVVNVGYSDTLEHLTTNAKWWLGNSGGEVKVAVVITVDEHQPVIQIEVWQNPAPPPAPNRRITRALNAKIIPARAQKITMTLQGQDTSNRSIVVSGAPLTLPFSDIFLRDLKPAPSPEGDFIFQQADLEQFARNVWTGQRFW